MGLVKEKGVYIFEEFLDFGILAGFTDRTFPGLIVEDDLKAISSSLDFTYQNLHYLNQVHGNSVIYPKGNTRIYTADGLISDKKRQVLIVRTADCIPVFFYDSLRSVSGIIHLGWKPAKENILNEFIDKATEDLKVNLNESFIGIGPGLRKCCFEVKEEFLSFSCFSDFIEKRNSRYFLDMVAFLKKTFIDRGLLRDNFLDSQICTICNKEFYSYRRDKTQNRTISFIIQR